MHHLGVIGHCSDYRDHRDFGIRRAKVEAFWISHFNCLAPRGYNLRNASWVHRNRDMAKRRRDKSKADKAAQRAVDKAVRNHIPTSAGSLPQPRPDSHSPPAPPLFPPTHPTQVGLLAGPPAPAQPAPPQHPAGGVHNASRACSAYAILAAEPAAMRGQPLLLRLSQGNAHFTESCIAAMRKRTVVTIQHMLRRL